MAPPNSGLQQTWPSLRSDHAAEACYVGQTAPTYQQAQPWERRCTIALEILACSGWSTRFVS
jgi:hypothetical protein